MSKVKAAATELNDIRSLRDLMADDEPDTTGAMTVALALIDPDEHQPRRSFEQKGIDELAESMAVAGMIQPLIVSRHPTDAGRYKLIAGERRWRAAQQARLIDVLVIVRELSPAQCLAVQLLENTDREPLNILDEALAVERMVNLGNTPKKVGEMLAKTKTWVSLRRKIAAHVNQIDVFVNGNRTHDPEALCLLIDLEELDPTAVSFFLCEDNKVTRTTVRQAVEAARANLTKLNSEPEDIPAPIAGPAEPQGPPLLYTPRTLGEPDSTAPPLGEADAPLEPVASILEHPLSRAQAPAGQSSNPAQHEDRQEPRRVSSPATPPATTQAPAAPVTPPAAEPKGPSVKPVIDGYQQKTIDDRCRAAEAKIRETWNLQVTAVWSGKGEQGELRIEFKDFVDLDNLAACLGA